MTNYSTLNLNSNLRPTDSPGVKHNDARTTGYEFNSQNERDAITATNIKNFSFSTGKGGTLTLGGTANGNGYFTIKNSAGSVIVTADNTGITVTNGSIVIKNTGGTTSLDASGVVSSSNFQGVSVTSNGTFNTTGTTLVDVPNSSLTQLILPRTTRVLCFFFAYGWNSKWNDAPTIQSGVEIKYINNDGSVVINNFLTGNAFSYIDGSTEYYIMHAQSIYRQQINSLVAGTYDFKLQFRTKGDGTAQIFAYENGYIVLGT